MPVQKAPDASAQGQGCPFHRVVWLRLPCPWAEAQRRALCHLWAGKCAYVRVFSCRQKLPGQTKVWRARRKKESVHQPRLSECRPMTLTATATSREQTRQSATDRVARRADTPPVATPRLTAARSHQLLRCADGSRRVPGRSIHKARVLARVSRDKLVQVRCTLAIGAECVLAPFGPCT